MKKILITAGGTKIKIDQARFISNSSSGATGEIIADKLKNECDVTLISSNSSIADHIPYQTFEELDQLIKTHLSNSHFDAVIHLAAVSDYNLSELYINNQLQRSLVDKIPSGQEITIKLTPTLKLINKIKSISVNPDIILIGFKLTVNLDQESILKKVNDLFLNAKCDYVVQNDLSLINKTQHHYSIFNHSQMVKTGSTKNELATDLLSIIRGNL